VGAGVLEDNWIRLVPHPCTHQQHTREENQPPQKPPLPLPRNRVFWKNAVSGQGQRWFLRGLGFFPGVLLVGFGVLVDY